MTDAEIAARLSIPVAIVTAIRLVESGAKPNPHALRFEPRLFRHARPELADAFPCTGALGTRAETDRAAFERALVAAPREAVLCSSFGAYQVMGSHLLAITHLGPVEAVHAFDAASDGLSGALHIDWCEKAHGFLEAARKDPPDFDAMAMRYNGKISYAAKLRARYYEALASK